ncbi:Ribosomal protein L14 [Spironucleus salmonicida]|uniref:Ribosomal protein L14 n=1 Tax=Spironucleus salmonicida TaxID=348837 RepID=V6LJF1_9EUKA|nr:Ribosomal protein L14 [Spironucleus salmonicida]|eukprot:EST44508.1 Ribosomal protein L14 [Spironucleus salmonicida]
MSKIFVQYGRVVMVDAGEFKSKVAMITDIVDYKTIQIEGPEVKRHICPIKRVVLTEFVHSTETPVTSADCKKAFNAEKFVEKFAATQKGKEVALENKYNALSEVEKIKLNIMKKQRARMIAKVACK